MKHTRVLQKIHLTLGLQPQNAWVIETYPTQSHEVLKDGTVEVTLVITALPWLERLLLQLGRGATVLGSTGLDDVDQMRIGGARRILTRYGR